MKHYDFIMAGGGAAGLGLAYQMAQSSLKDRSILIIDKDRKEQNDRTWCFWSENPTPFDPILYRSWDRINFIGEQFERVISLGSFRYNMIRGIDFYQFAREQLAKTPGVEFLQSGVDEIRDGPDRAVVTAGGTQFSANWVFDSIIRPGDIQKDPRRYHYLNQHFLGWEIETPDDCFDPETPVLFDFRTEQLGAMRFFYILPFSPRRAMVEYTLFSAQLLSQEEYESATRRYIEQTLGIANYRVETVESGIIPMTDHPFPRRLGARVMAIGTKGGRVKSSSGYAFLRMQQDGDSIVRSLEQSGDPFQIPASPRRYSFYDTIMLQLMYRQGGRMKEIFTQLFKNNPPKRIFQFLDENQSLWQDIRLMASLPTRPFFVAMLKVYLLRKV